MQRIVVAPILVGLPFAFSLNFSGVSGFDLTTAAQILAHFRSDIDDSGAPYATIDTGSGSITVVDADTLSFSLTAAQTAMMPRGGPVWVDFLRRDGSIWSPLTGHILWPVSRTITRPA